jgi:beta-lactamase regulating signal transducer with metallopeptidase domain
LLDATLVQSIGWALIHFIWQGAVIGGATALLLRAIDPQKAAMRYFVACLGLGVMPIAPVFSVLTNDPYAGELVTAASASRGIATVVPMDRMLALAVGIWMAGVVLLSIRLVAACIGVERLKRATREVDEAVLHRLHVLARRLGVGRTVHVFASEVVCVPTVVGWLRPVVLLPVSVITGLPATHLDAVLAHELAHVRRHDYLVNALQAIIETLLFYHPAVWWCSRQIRIEREHCCDDLVVAACGDRAGYARALARLEELRGLEPRLSLNATGGRLIDRVRRMLGHEPMNARRSTTWMIAAGVTVVVVAVIVAPVLTIAGADDGLSKQGDITLQEPPAPPAPPVPPVPVAPRPPRVPQPPIAQPLVAPPIPPAPPAPLAPLPPLQPGAAVPALPDLFPVQPAPPEIPAPPAPLAFPVPPPVFPVPPAPPLPPVDIAQIDPDSIASEMRRADQELTRSFDDLRRATEIVNAKQEALRQAQVELAEMQRETLAKNTQIEAIRKAMAELSAAMASSRLGQLKEEALRKEIEAIRKQMESLRAR